MKIDLGKVTGPAGKSAYEVWKENQGGTGSVIDFLNSLEGKSAYEIWLSKGNSGTEQDFLDSLKGKDLSSDEILKNLNNFNKIDYTAEEGSKNLITSGAVATYVNNRTKAKPVVYKTSTIHDQGFTITPGSIMHITTPSADKRVIIDVPWQDNLMIDGSETTVIIRAQNNDNVNYTFPNKYTGENPTVTDDYSGQIFFEENSNRYSDAKVSILKILCVDKKWHVYAHHLHNSKPIGVTITLSGANCYGKHQNYRQTKVFKTDFTDGDKLYVKISEFADAKWNSFFGNGVCNLLGWTDNKTWNKTTAQYSKDHEFEFDGDANITLYPIYELVTVDHDQVDIIQAGQSYYNTVWGDRKIGDFYDLASILNTKFGAGTEIHSNEKSGYGLPMKLQIGGIIKFGIGHKGKLWLGGRVSGDQYSIKEFISGQAKPGKTTEAETVSKVMYWEGCFSRASDAKRYIEMYVKTSGVPKGATAKANYVLRIYSVTVGYNRYNFGGW